MGKEGEGGRRLAWQFSLRQIFDFAQLELVFLGPFWGAFAVRLIGCIEDINGTVIVAGGIWLPFAAICWGTV